MPIKRVPWGIWAQVSNTAAPNILCSGVGCEGIWNYRPYKLHISINPTCGYDREKLNTLLDEATEQLIITDYKRLDVDPKNMPFSDRAIYSPYALYLQPKPNQENLNQVFLLCNEIEKILHGIPASNDKYFTLCDLKLSEHLRFRQSARNGREEYIAVHFQLPKYIPILAEEGRRSEPFLFLYDKLNPQLQIASTALATKKLEETKPSAQESQQEVKKEDKKYLSRRVIFLLDGVLVGNKKLRREDGSLSLSPEVIPEPMKLTSGSSSW